MFDEQVYLGYTHAELDAAFKKVEDKTNWKNPIDAVIPTSEYPVTAAAVTFFAGSNLDALPAGDGMYQVKAPGYYEDVGA